MISMKCPTCETATEGNCCTCSIEIPVDEQKLLPDPRWNEYTGGKFTGDKSLHLRCYDCRLESALDR